MKTIYTITAQTARKIKEHDERLRYELRNVKRELARFKTAVASDGGSIVNAVVTASIQPRSVDDQTGIFYASRPDPQGTQNQAQLVNIDSNTGEISFGQTVGVVNHWNATVPENVFIQLAIIAGVYYLNTVDCATV